MNMADSRRPLSPNSNTLAAGLVMLGVAAMTAGVLLGLAVLTVHPRAESAVSFAQAATALAVIVLGACVAGAMWALGHMVRRGDQAGLPGRVAPQQRLEAEQDSSAKLAAMLDALQKLQAELSQINANLLLSPGQREVRRREHQAEQARRLIASIESAMAGLQIESAEQLLRRLQAEVPDCERIASLRTALEAAAVARQAQEIAAQAKRAGDYMSMASFEQAATVARQLLDRYPQSPEAAALVEQVQREAKMFEQEQRRRLYSQITRHGQDRQWRLALEAAHKFMEAFPRAPEADLVRAQMATIQDNARFEEVRELRDQIRDMIARKHYREALTMARDLVERFPQTAAAEELQRQMDRLAEKAAKESR